MKKSYSKTKTFKTVMKILFFLMLFVPYAVEKNDEEGTTHVRAVFYGILVQRQFNEETRKEETAINIYPFGILGDQLSAIGKFIKIVK